MPPPSVPIDFHALRRGDALPTFEFSVTTEEARAYLQATGEASVGDASPWDELVPPLAIGALTLAGLMERMPLPPGALHGGQEFEFLGAVRHGEAIEALLSVAQQSERQGSNIVVFASELRCSDRVVLRGRSTVVAPVAAPPTTPHERPSERTP